MKTLLTIDKPGRTGRATQIAAMVITGPGSPLHLGATGRVISKSTIPANGGSPISRLDTRIYIIPLIGVTHIPWRRGPSDSLNVPRLTEWIYAGLSIDLLLSAFLFATEWRWRSTWDKVDPLLVL